MVGIVLGAGSSRRLGRPKQTLPLGDTTLLGWMLRDVEVSALDRIVLVVGGAADEALAGLNLRRATVAYNESYGTGCASWLLAGLDAAGSWDAVMLLLGDNAVWKLVEPGTDRVREVPISRPLPRDVDTWENYEAACRRLGVEPAAEPATR
jgi:molybdenum cofactor cytidylyltransferase